MRKTLLAIAFTMATAAGSCLEVNTTAGSLASQVSDHTITNLTVNGTLDARDFRFIADSLMLLEQVDLSGAEIVAYSNNSNPVFGTVASYAAGVLPRTSFMGKKHLNSVTLPATLTGIGKAAFAGCTSLTGITLPAGVDSIADLAFSGSGLTGIMLGEQVKHVGMGAFSRCGNMTSASVMAGTLGDCAFLGCTSLTGIALGNGVTALGESALVGSALQAFDAGGTTLRSIGSWAMTGTPVTTASLPATLTTLGEGAFYVSRRLANVNLPGSMTEVPAYALAGDTLLALSYLIPEGVTTVGDYALYNNSQPTDTVVLPSTLSYIGTQAMAGMTGMQNIAPLATTVPTLGSDVWAGVNQPVVNLDTRETSGNTVADLYANADQWMNFHVLRNYLIGDVNMDNAVSMADVTTLIAYVLGNDPSPCDVVAADVNTDGNVSMADVTTLINRILTGANGTVRRIRGTGLKFNETSDRLTLPALGIAAGESRTLQVSLTDQEHGYNALQCIITLPQGLTLTQVQATGRGAKHTFISRAIGDNENEYMLVGYSPVNKYFSPGDAELLTLTITASDDYKPCNGIIMLTDLLLVCNNTDYAAPESEAPVTEPTGVQNVDAMQNRIYAYGNVLVIEAASEGAAQVVTMGGISRELPVATGRNEFSDLPAGIYIVRLGQTTAKVTIR